MTVVMYQVTGLTCSFVYSMGLQTMGIIQLVTHINFFFPHTTREPADPNNLSNTNDGRSWFTETRVFLNQAFVLVHNARFHSECYRNYKGSKQTCENNTNSSTNTQYLKFHVRILIRSQNSQRWTNTMK